MIANFNPKVSIIAAIYKSEPFLDKLIQSLIHQTYRNIEIILVDDGSPDGSGEICDKYAASDDRIRVIHKENGGTSDARNAGMKIMTGDYLMIADGDDWLAEDCVQYMVNIIAETGAEMAMSTKIFTTRDMTQTKEDRIETWTPEDAAAAILYPVIPIGPWNKIYSTDMLRENNMSFTNLWFGEGLMFSCEAAQHSNRVGVGHRKVYVYRMNNLNSGLTNYNVQHGFNAYNNIRKIKRDLYIDSEKLRRAADWHIYKNYGFLLLQIIGSGQVDAYRKEYDDCIRHSRRDMLKVLVKSKVNFKQKLKIILQGLFPVTYTRLMMWRSKRALARDCANLKI